MGIMHWCPNGCGKKVFWRKGGTYSPFRGYFCDKCENYWPSKDDYDNNTPTIYKDKNGSIVKVKELFIAKSPTGLIIGRFDSKSEAKMFLEYR